MPKELENIIRRIATRCYYRIIEMESSKRYLTDGAEGLTEMKRIDFYQYVRDTCFDKYGAGMFFEDFYNLFDKIYKEIEDERELVCLVDC